MQLKLAAAALAVALAFGLGGQASAQNDPLQCRSYASQVEQARTSRERLGELIQHPRANDCPVAANEARRYYRALQPAPAPAPANSGEPAAWQLAARVDSAAAYAAYLDQYPNGANAAEARRRLRAALPQTQPQEATRTAPPARTPPLAGAPQPQPTQAARAPIQEFDDCNGEAWCPRMVVVPAGSYNIGSPATELGRRNDESQRPLNVPSFAIGKFEITAAQWRACVAARRCEREIETDGQVAVTYVDWHDAQQYVAWLSQRTGHTYRLPSEGEWEYAARAGSTGMFSWGNEGPVCEEDAPNGASFAGCARGRRSGAMEVGQFRPNAFGLYDMHGNVWEMVRDCYAPLGQLPEDGSANIANGCDRNGGVLGVGARGMTTLMRGGSWLDQSINLRSARREAIYQNYRHRHVGFRVARDL